MDPLTTNDTTLALSGTIGDNAAAGLTTGRELILDYQAGLSVCEAGGGVTEGDWAGFGYLNYTSGFNYSVLPLPAGPWPGRYSP